MEDRQTEFSIHKCEVCNGFGTLSYGKKICHACGGKGQVVIDEKTGLIVQERQKDDRQKL